MWLLENNLFDGKKLWLRPGSRYLFGRTPTDPESGHLQISHGTVSKKHITLEVDKVPEGSGRNLQTRSRITIRDLDTKHGTLLNGVQIRGETKTLSGDENEVKLARAAKLHIIWHPVVLSFSFTSKELRADPWKTLRESLEQLDIKYSAEYEKLTSHVVAKKRNTSKGLQALINGRLIVTDSFIDAVVAVATVPAGAELGATSLLEQDFEGNWPNALDHLPPRGEEPTSRLPEAYAPDERRQEVFDGYTFVFYDKKQYDNLFSAITNGKGKAVLKEVTPGVTDIDDFIRYVKGVAGEKGVGSFEDGSEGKGVVVVRYMPAKGSDFNWYAQFLTSFAQRLDHRPIDQREFLDAILACDASMLRRPLEEESQNQQAAPRAQQSVVEEESRTIAQPAPQQQAPEEPAEEPAVQDEPVPPPRRGRPRRGEASRFKGFDLDDDDDSPAPQPVQAQEVQSLQQEPAAPAAEASQDSLFVSQRQDLAEAMDYQEEQPVQKVRRPQRKRPLSPLPEHDDSAFLDGIAPTAAAAKRRRIEAGQPAVPPPEPKPKVKEDVDMQPESPPQAPPKKTTKAQAAKGRGKKAAGDTDEILELARKHREEEEARLAAERRMLEHDPDDEIDYAAIRALHIIEECEVHYPKENANSRDQEGTSSRWDPRWNGRKNFKRFRKQGDPAGRPAPRIILELEEVPLKEYGIGDDYWLENEGTDKRKKNNQRESQAEPVQNSLAKEKERPLGRRTVIALDSSDEEGENMVGNAMEDDEPAELEPEPPRSRAAKAAEKAASLRTQSQSQEKTQTQTQTGLVSSIRAGKRAAAPEPAKERAAKRPRRGLRAKESEGDEEDSDDELKFRFGRRRG
ncbi:hypothetical protein B0T25DRAFT_271086 [Lasiosphaeria hispida]|uniref:FHA domain-containing protein n=1 Tax=Lasiosphaeria hispida TaxID=260671 RepID=A0AAJ0MAE2_9PEZI|nr:hypothetical protein B0T25DRAFT_271086 [Lasiosphaeria hispida]